MANSLYNYARQLAATTGLTWTTGVFRAYLIDDDAAPGYTFSAAHQYFSSLDVATRAAGPVALTCSAADGACDASDITFTAVAAGPAIDAVMIMKFVSVDGDSPNVAWIDTATGLPITPNGGDIIVTWDSGTNKIFRV
jgi:hypothetical protein